MKTTHQKGNKKQSAAPAAPLDQPGRSLKKYYYLFGLMAFFLFANTLGNNYNMDDSMVTINHKLTSQGLSAIGEIFTSPYYSDAMGYAYGYRPIVHLSYAIEHELFGEKPGTGHFINVFLFAVSVVLFFKLLIRWVGQKNILLAGIATALFAVHPLHTEVVASLKNRDEILAFLFSIWAGLSAHNYITKGRWISIVSIFCLFSLAMLSKKSAYPMAVILPAAYLLLNKLTIKQLIFISIPFIIPAAFIGAELQMSRVVLMIIFPFILLALIYLIQQLIVQKHESGYSDKVWSLAAFAILILVGSAALFFNSITTLFFLIVPFLILIMRTNSQQVLLTLAVSVLFFGIYFSDYTLLSLSLILSAGYTLYRWKAGEQIKVWILLCTAALLGFLLIQFGVLKLLIAAGIILFFVLTYYKAWLSPVAVAVTIAVYLLLDKSLLNIHTISITVFSVSWLIYKQSGHKRWISYTPTAGFIISMLLVTYSNYQQHESEIQETQDVHGKQSVENQQGTAFLKEGRQLEYAENTLVVPHSQTEKIATGFLTLGEYMRLHLFPKELSFYYGYAKIKTVGLSHPLVIVSIIFHLLLMVVAVWQLKKRPLITIGIMWYLLSIVLFSNWVELVAGMVGERLAFTASAGFCIFIAALIFWIQPDFNLKKPGITGAVTGIALLLLAGRTITRNNDWKDTMTLMSHDIKHLENSAQANNMYARTLMGESMQNKNLNSTQRLEMQQTAIAHFDKATELWPAFFNAYFDKGMAARIAQNQDKAIESFRKVIEMNPQFTDAYTNLIEVYEITGKKDEQLATAQQLMEVSDSNISYALLSRSYFVRNEFDKSAETLKKGLEKYPNDELLLKNLEIVNQQKKNIQN